MRKTSEDFESVRTHLPLSSSSICLLLALALNTRGRSRPCTDRPPRCSPSRPVAAARAIYCGCCLCGFVDTGAAMHVSHTDPACDVHLARLLQRACKLLRCVAQRGIAHLDDRRSTAPRPRKDPSVPQNAVGSGSHDDDDLDPAARAGGRAISREAEYVVRSHERCPPSAHPWASGLLRSGCGLGRAGVVFWGSGPTCV